MVTIAETGPYQRQAKKYLSEEDNSGLIEYLAKTPKAGEVIEGTGGVRKLRWSSDGKGKSGGNRIIYFYHNDRMPLYLLTVFGKKDKDNLSKAERNDIKKLVDILVKSHGL